MKRWYVAALLALLSTPAFAGNSLSFSGGRRDPSEAVRECNARSCASSARAGTARNRYRDERYDDEQDDDDRYRDARRINDARALPPAPQAVSPPPPAPLPPVAKPVEPVRAAPPPISLSSSHAKDDADAPIGDWQTEAKGWVRITRCGKALCGYVLSSSSNDQGEVVLVNMKLANDDQWSGSVYSQSSGDTYYGTMELKGPNRLRVEACAIGRFYCSGNNWSRVNISGESLMSSRQPRAEPRS